MRLPTCGYAELHDPHQWDEGYDDYGRLAAWQRCSGTPKAAAMRPTLRARLVIYLLAFALRGISDEE